MKVVENDRKDLLETVIMYRTNQTCVPVSVCVWSGFVDMVSTSEIISDLNHLNQILNY